jgi:hypothetical protein
MNNNKDMKKLLAILFIFCSIGLFGQGYGAIDNRFVQTQNVYISTLVGDSTRFVVVDSTGRLLSDSVYRVKLSDSTLYFATPYQLSTNVPKGASGTVLVGKGVGVSAEFSSTIDGKLTYAGTPTLNADLDIPTKAYVDAMAIGLSIKDTVSLATTANLDLAGAETIDGIATVNGMRILVKNQTDSITNGIYVVAAGTWARATDSDLWAEVYKAFIAVSRGSTQSGSSFVCGVGNTGDVDTDKIWYNLFSSPPSYLGGDGLTKTGNTFSVNVDNTTTAISGDNVIVKTGGIGNTQIGNNIDVAQLADGTVSNTELQYINSVTSNVQNQINAKLATSKYSTRAYNSTKWNGSDSITTQNAIRDQFVADSSYMRANYDSSIVGLSYVINSYTTNLRVRKKGGSTSDVAIPTAGSTYSGLMSATMVNKLAGIQAGAEENVRASWTAAIGDSVITNKPDIIIKSDTMRNAVEQIATGYLVDSIYNNLIDSINAVVPSTQYWTVSTNGDSITPTVNVVKLDTVVMGASEIFYPKYAVYDTSKFIWDGVSSVSTVSGGRVIREYVMSETGAFRYRIKDIASTTVDSLQRSIDNGATWTNLCGVNYHLYGVNLKCSNYGDVVAYSDFLTSTNYMHISTDYGSTFNSYVICTMASTVAIDISDDGSLVAFGADYDSIYIYRSSFNRVSLVGGTKYINDIKVDNDSTIYYTTTNADNFNRTLWSIQPSSTTSVSKQTSLYQCFFFDYEGSKLYVNDSSKIYTSIDGGDNLVLLEEFKASEYTGTFKTYGVSVSKDGTYIYVPVYGSSITNDIYLSTNSGGTFAKIVDSAPPVVGDNIDINEGIASSGVKYYFMPGRMNFSEGGITMGNAYTPINNNDVATKAYADALARGSGTGTFLGVTTTTTSGLSGGTTTGIANMSISFPNISSSQHKTSPASTDRFIIGDYAASGALKYITAGELQAYCAAASGVTSITQGNGLSFSVTPIETTGTISLKSPTEYITETTSAGVTSLGHTHKFDMGTFELEDLGDITAPTIASTYLKVLTVSPTITYTWAAGTGASGVTSLTTATAGGIYNISTAADPSIVFNIYGLATTVTPTLSDWIPFADNSSSSTPKLNEKMTLATLKSTLGAGLIITDSTSIPHVDYSSADTLVFSGLTVTASASGDRVTVSGGSGGGFEGFQNLGALTEWSWLTNNNAYMTMSGIRTLTFVNMDDGEEGELWVIPHGTTDYILTLPTTGYYYANHHDNTFNIEAGTHIYVFTFKWSAGLSKMRVDYATYEN